MLNIYLFIYFITRTEVVSRPTRKGWCSHSVFSMSCVCWEIRGCATWQIRLKLAINWSVSTCTSISVCSWLPCAVREAVMIVLLQSLYGWWRQYDVTALTWSNRENLVRSSLTKCYMSTTCTIMSRLWASLAELTAWFDLTENTRRAQTAGHLVYIQVQ